MLRKIMLATAICLQFAVCSASPLNDFTKHSLALDVNYNVAAFEGSDHNYNFSITKALQPKWAVNYRQTQYSPSYQQRDFDASNKELNIIYKMDDHWQLYSGYSRTTASHSGAGIPAKNVAQIGVIGLKKLSPTTTLYTILGGGQNVANVEFGLSYQLSPDVELTSTYRHFSVEKVGPTNDKLNLRGFGLGITYKF